MSLQLLSLVCVYISIMRWSQNRSASWAERFWTSSLLCIYELYDYYSPIPILSPFLFTPSRYVAILNLQDFSFCTCLFNLCLSIIKRYLTFPETCMHICLLYSHPSGDTTHHICPVLPHTQRATLHALVVISLGTNAHHFMCVLTKPHVCVSVSGGTRKQESVHGMSACTVYQHTL